MDPLDPPLVPATQTGYKSYDILHILCASFNLIRVWWWIKMSYIWSYIKLKYGFYTSLHDTWKCYMSLYDTRIRARMICEICYAIKWSLYCHIWRLSILHKLDDQYNMWVHVWWQMYVGAMGARGPGIPLIFLVKCNFMYYIPQNFKIRYFHVTKV